MLKMIKWPSIFLHNLKPIFVQGGDWSLEAPQGRLETSWGDWGAGFLATRGTIVSVRWRNIWARFSSAPALLKCIYHTDSAENLVMNMGTLYDTVFKQWHWSCLYCSSWGHFSKCMWMFSTMECIYNLAS